MGNTIKITKSKSFTYKKLNFLYLIFLVFMFFSNNGEYLRHYPSLFQTQSALNERLLTKLQKHKSTTPENQNLKALTIKYLADIERFEKAYVKYKGEKNLEGKKLYASDFINSKFRFKELGKEFERVNAQYQADFLKITKQDISSEFKKVKDELGVEFDLEDFYFQELPNTAFQNVMEHFKSKALYHSAIVIFGDDFSISRNDLVSMNQAKFIQKLKSKYSIGETVEFEVTTDDSKSVPVVKIEGQSIIPKKMDSITYKYNFVPSNPGNLNLEVISGNKRLLSHIQISKPEFKVVTDKSLIDGAVGDKLNIRLAKDFKLPKGCQVSSTGAQVALANGELLVTPLVAGRISVSLIYNGEVVDDLFVFAHQAKTVDVALQDISGNETNIVKAYRLESKNTFWQVVGFRMTIIEPSGKKTSRRSATRFLRNELKALENNAAANSTVVFDEIRVIGREKGLTNTGKPIIFVK